MTKTTDETAPSGWRIAETDCSDLEGTDPELLAMIASQCPISLPLRSSLTSAAQLHGEIQPGPTISLAELLGQFGASIALARELDGTWSAAVLSCHGLPLHGRYLTANAPGQAEAVSGIAALFEGTYCEIPTPRRWWHFWVPPQISLNLTRTRVVVTEDALPIKVVLEAPQRALEAARSEPDVVPSTCAR